MLRKKVENEKLGLTTKIGTFVGCTWNTFQIDQESSLPPKILKQTINLIV